MFQQHKKIYPVKHFRDFIERNIREDGREFDDFRPLAITVGIFDSADGSSAVKLGNSNVICGIKADLAKPAADAPSNGYIIPKINMSFIPQTVKTKLNINNELPDTLRSMLYKVLLDSEVVKLTDLCIVPQKLVWTLNIDITCMELDGGVFDASVLACVAALKNLTLRTVKYDADLNKVESVGEREKKININAKPIISSFVMFEGHVLTDPCNEEEFISNAVLYLSSTKGNVGLVSKRGGKPVSVDVIEKCMQTAEKRENEILDLLDNLESNNEVQ